MIRKCVCCGKEYDYCPGCHKKDQPAWMATFCCEKCKELFNIISAYNVKRIDKNAVKRFVLQNRIDESKYLEPIQKVLNDVKDPVVSSMAKVEQPLKSEPTSLSSAERNESFRTRRNRKRKSKHVDIELN